VSQQVRAEFLLVYKRTTNIRVQVDDLVDDLKEYIQTWLSGPAAPGTIMVTFHNDDVRLLRGTWKAEGPVEVNIIPLLKLRCAEAKFQFYMHSDKTRDAVTPTDDAKDIEDSIDRVDISGVYRRHGPLLIRLKPGHMREAYIKAGTKGPYIKGKLNE
jgi:hypothetical protein